MTTRIPKIIERKPVTRKLGIIVKAGSPPCHMLLAWGAIAFISMPFGATLPWSVSKYPCCIPSSPAYAPKIEATARLALIAIMVARHSFPRRSVHYFRFYFPFSVLFEFLLGVRTYYFICWQCARVYNVNALTSVMKVGEPRGNRILLS